MDKQSLWFLENIDVGGIFCPNKMDQNMSHDHVKEFKKNDYIYLPEQSSDKIYFLSEGRIKIGSYSSGGKEITKAILESGQVFGELALIGEEKRRDFAVCLEDSKICAVTLGEMKDLIKDHSKLSLFMMKIVGSRVLEIEKRLESLVFKDSRSRIVEYLEELVEKKGQRVGYEWVVRNFYTHQEIANITATSRQTVTTVLNELRAADILTFNRKRLLVRDLDALKNEIRA